MQITLNHSEILAALDNYVRERIAIAPSQQVVIEMKAGRSDNGFSATLDIVERTDQSADAAVEKAPTRINIVQQAPAQPEAVEPAPAKKSVFSAAKSAPVEAPTEDTGPVEIAEDEVDLSGDEGDEAVAPEPPAEAAPVKKSIFSKAS